MQSFPGLIGAVLESTEVRQYIVGFWAWWRGKLLLWSIDSRSGRMLSSDDGCNTGVPLQNSCAIGHHSRPCGRGLVFILQRNNRSFATGISSWLQRSAQTNYFNDLQIRKNWPNFCAVRDVFALFGLNPSKQEY